jgi:glycine betaine/proline transport system substrate-binding protein
MRHANTFAPVLALMPALLVAYAVVSPLRAAEIVIGNPQTPYTDAIAAVTKAVLEDRLGVQARTVHASGAVIFKAMDANKGDIDVDPGMQMPNNQSLVDEYVTRKGTVIVASNSWQFGQGICTTKSAAERYRILSVYDMLRPEIVQLTAKNGSSKGEYWVGAADWNSAAIDKVRARFYGLTELYELTTSSPEFEYARVSNAIRSASAIFWACDSASNFIFPKGSVVLLTEPPHDPAKWHPVLPSKDPNWYQLSAVETSWPPVTVTFAYAKHLQTDFPEVARTLERIKMTADMVGEWTYATIVEKHDVTEYAKQWVKENGQTVNGWLAR